MPIEILQGGPKKQSTGRNIEILSGGPKSSAASAFGRGALESAVPTIAGLGAMGLATAATGGGALIPIGAGLLTGFGASKLQDVAGKTLFPEQRGQFLRQRQTDIQEHPVASTLGEFAPSLIALKPGIPRTLSQAKIALGSGAIQGGIETGAELARGEQLNPARIATSAGLGLTTSRPTAIGRRLGFRAEPARVSSALDDSLVSPESRGRVQKITQAIKEAKPVRGEQEALYTKARGERLARLLSVREKVGGEAGFHAELGQLKGELPRVQFESIRAKVGQSDIDGLFNDINSASIDPWDQLHAKGGLANLLEGKVPTRSELNILNRVFGQEFTTAALSKRPLFQKATDLGLEIASLPKSLMASIDLSAPMRQGLFLIGRPKQWMPAFGSMLKQFVSEKSFVEGQRQISGRATYPIMKQSRLALTDIGTDFRLREEAFMSRIAERFPGIRQSNRAYVGFLNKLRADVFDDLLKKGQALGVADDPQFTQNLADYINAATGRGHLGKLEKASVVLNATLFSPRLMSSRLSLLNPLFYMRLHPAVRQQAIRDLFIFASSGASILGLAKMRGANVGTDPRSADFGKVKVKNTRYDIWGGFQQPIVAATRLLTGQMVSSTTGREFALGEGYKATTRGDIIMRYLQSKQSPALSLITTLLRGKTQTGQPIRLSVEIADRFIPMFLSDMYEVMKEQGPAKGWMALPGAFGVGIQTYGDLIPLLERTESGAPTVKFRDQPSLGETLVNKAVGTNVSNIPERFHPNLKRVKEFQIRREIEINKAKRIVLETGRPIRVGNTLVYLQNGIVKTRSFGAESKMTPENVLRSNVRQEAQ